MVSLNNDESISSLKGLVTTQKLCHSNDQPLQFKLLRFCTLYQQYPTFWAPGTKFRGRDFFQGLEAGRRGWFLVDSRTLHLLCTLFLFCGSLKIFHLDSHSYENLMPPLNWQEVECGWWCEQWGSGCKHRWNLDCLPTAHLLLCGPVGDPCFIPSA